MTTEQSNETGARPALVVGHPGHELRVYGWMMRVRPIVHVLTDGSGSRGESRLDSTRAVLDEVGALGGSVFGRMSDREIYGAMLAGDDGRFLALAEELAATFVRDRIDTVAGDAVEGFNPSHDVCRYVINAAVRIASASGRSIKCYAFPLDRAPGTDPDRVHSRPLRLELDDATLARKLHAAHEYPELRSEVESAIRRYGSEPFRTECLWPVDLTDPYGWDPDVIPYYEAYGAQRVAEGAYQHIVRFREHVKPIADALWCHRAVVA